MPVASECKETILPALALNSLHDANTSFFVKSPTTPSHQYGNALPSLMDTTSMEIEGAATTGSCEMQEQENDRCSDACNCAVSNTNTEIRSRPSSRSSTPVSSTSDESSESQADKSAMEIDSPSAPPSPSLATRHMVIVFDWDDTLLCSSFLSSKGYRLDTPMTAQDAMIPLLRDLEESVIAVLTRALRTGNEVHIITNAETGWVELSAKKFLPRVLPLLSQVTVLSARSTYEHQFPESPLQWKTSAFRARVQPLARLESSITKHVVSFGDSHVEREACRIAARELQNVRTKSVKFADRPSMEQLRRQLDLVNNCFEYIHTHDGDLDLMLTISVMY